MNFEIDKNGSSFSSLFPSDTTSSQKESDVKSKKQKKEKKKKKSAQKEVMAIESSNANVQPDIRLNHLVLNDCEVNFTDRTLKDEVMTLPVSNIMVDAHN